MRAVQAYQTNPVTQPDWLPLGLSSSPFLNEEQFIGYNLENEVQVARRWAAGSLLGGNEQTHKVTSREQPFS